jgi:hypothetical protein
MKKFLMIAALCTSAMMASAGVADNEVLSNYLKETQEEIAKDGGQEVAAMTVEESPFGDLLVMTINVPVTGDQLKQIPVDMVKPEMLKSFKDEKTFPAEVIDAMSKERVNFIYRMKGTDGNSLDIFITPTDLK